MMYKEISEPNIGWYSELVNRVYMDSNKIEFSHHAPKSDLIVGVPNKQISNE